MAVEFPIQLEILPLSFLSSRLGTHCSGGSRLLTVSRRFEAGPRNQRSRRKEARLLFIYRAISVNGRPELPFHLIPLPAKPAICVRQDQTDANHQETPCLSRVLISFVQQSQVT